MAAANPQMTPAEIEIASWDLPFRGVSLQQLAAILPAYITVRRWYRAKARTIRNIGIPDVIAIGDSNSFILLVEIDYEDGGSDLYNVPVRLERKSSGEVAEEDIVAHVKGPQRSSGVLVNALSYEDFRQDVLEAIVCNRIFEGPNGSLVAWRTRALDRRCDGTGPPLPSFMSRAEQSNSSIVFGNKYILKLFRKLEEGINPDVEIGNFLTARGFKYSPAVLGNIDYRTDSGRVCYATGILQQFVPNRGDAWKYTLDSLAGYFRRALSPAANGFTPVLGQRHPLELLHQQPNADARELFGDYEHSAALLGRRTAQMHAALTDDQGGADFAPELFTPEDREKLHREMMAQSDIAFELLRRKQPVLAGAAAESARQLLNLESRVASRFESLHHLRVRALRVRHHGDYHLGQVLYTGDDFVIIDYEGEPARPLKERRSKTLAMRDVAGMIRSFQYAAFAALFGQVPGVPSNPEMADAIESWATFWTIWMSAIFLRAYFDEGQFLASVPSDDSERRLLLDAFLLQKALYELAYELNNRPDWVRIPMGGILSLMAA